ncbi:MAG: hypothetical protein DCC67_16230 [Planctomycetota bacterium]|nr:MAG: hypothetical protein DCC67_16230 [Planctomycetota bacterium]
MQHFIMAWALALATVLGGCASAGAATYNWSLAALTPGSSMQDPANWVGGVTPASGSENLTIVVGRWHRPLGLRQDIAPTFTLQRLQMSATGYPSDFGYRNGLHGGVWRFDDLGAAPSIHVGNAEFTAPVEFAAPTTVQIEPYEGLTFRHLTMRAAVFRGQMDSAYAPSVLTIVDGSIDTTGVYTLEGGLVANVQTEIGGTIILSGDAQQQTWYALPQLAPSTITAGSAIDAVYGSVALPSSHLGRLSMQNTQVMPRPGSVFTIDNLVHRGGWNQLGGLRAYAPPVSGGGDYPPGDGTFDLGSQVRTIDITEGGAESGLLIGSKVAQGSIIKTGPGWLGLFHPDNVFTAPIVVSEGTLAGHTNTLGTSVVNNSRVYLVAGNLSSPLISGPGSVQVGDVVFSAAQSYTGGTDIQRRASGDAATLLGDFSSSNAGELAFVQETDGAFTGRLSGNVRVSKSGSGVLSLGGSSAGDHDLRLLQGGVKFLNDTSVGSGKLIVDTTHAVTIEAEGSRIFTGVTQFATPAAFVGAGDIRFTNTSEKTLATTLTHEGTGTTQFDGRFILAANGALVVKSGRLIVGDSSMAGGFTASGQIVIDGGVLTARNLGFLTLPNVTLAGGVLNVPGGFALPLGSVFTGHGGVDGRIAAVEGSTIAANGALALGDPAHPAGIDFGGELYTGPHAVTLLDANQAVLGSYTRLGAEGEAGALTASNGLLLHPGRSIVGHGRIETPNLPSKPLTANGDIQGDSPSAPLELTGFVTGGGRLDNVLLSGVYSPGTGAGVTGIGRAALASSAVLSMEIGGSVQGVYHDALAVDGALALNGTLQIRFISSYRPRVNDQFHLLQGEQHGAFVAFDFPGLDPGLEWDTSRLYDAGHLRVALQGDYDQDADADGADFLLWQRGYGQTSGATDLDKWRSRFGAHGASPASVPEPAALTIGAIAMGWAPFAGRRPARRAAPFFRRSHL